MKRFALLPIVTILLGSVVSANEQHYLDLLTKHGIDPTPESLTDYFASLRPGGEARRRVERLVQQLGADRFDVRENATRQLLRMPALSRALLVDASRSADPEIRWRARAILEQADQHEEDIFYAVMFVIENQKIKGLAGPMLEAMPYFQKSHLQSATHRALKSSVQESDRSSLAAGLSSKAPEVRIAAIVGLTTLGQPELRDQLKPLMRDPDEQVRLALSRAYADLGDRRSLPLLVGLLRSDNVSVRSQAVSMLRSLTRQQFDFVAYNDVEKRNAAEKKWRHWIDGPGQSSKLYFPLSLEPEHLGRVLVCNYSANHVTEYDAQGKEIWKKEGLDHPWGIQVLSNNHRLVAACNGRYLVEFDPSGKQVWRKDGLPGNPLSVQRLENGNTLVSTGSAGKVLEISPDGDIAWELSLSGFMADARRLKNGLTLIANYKTGEVVEVNREGKIVWRIGGFKNTRSAQRLQNGNTLVCDNGQSRVVECDRSGTVVWKYEGLSTTYDCQRLRDGTTLIGDSTGLRLVDQAGKTLWHRKMTSTGRIFGY